MSEQGYGQTSNYNAIGHSQNTVYGLRYKTTTHTKRKKLCKHCTHDNYLQIEINPVLDGFSKKKGT